MLDAAVFPKERSLLMNSNYLLTVDPNLGSDVIISILIDSDCTLAPHEKKKRSSVCFVRRTQFGWSCLGCGRCSGGNLKSIKC